MRVGIDGRALQGRRAGVARYVYELCRALDTALPEAVFFVYSQSAVTLPTASERWISRVDPLGHLVKNVAWLKFRCGALCRHDDLEVFWGTGTLLPRLPKRVRTVSTVHDLNHKLVPDTMPIVTLCAHRLFFSADVRRADNVVAVSHGTSDRLRHLIGRPADVVVPPSVDECFAPASTQAVRECRLRYGIAQPFLLAVATLEPRKNIAMLIDVFISMRATGDLPRGIELVLVGGTGWKDSAVARRIQAGQAHGVRTLGFVPDEDLPALYTASEAFVLPSRYEGFGIPVLEARACGTRVLTSDIPELREAGGADATYCEPTPEGLRNGLRTVLSSPRPQTVRVRVGWQDAAEQFASVLRDGSSIRSRLVL
ncbi:MAG TPA: glycosyltransferase family 1 protein [Gemmatimonadaceae bacterium]|nr:glycosyltransferase family 1 protein [Gemmatimonadaceae bacterium]